MASRVPSSAAARGLVALLAACVATLALIGEVAPAAAQAGTGRVAVLRVRGPRGGRARGMLVSSLEDAGYEIVGESEVDEVRRRLGVGDDPTEAEWASIAAELDVRAFVDGRVSHARRHWRLTVSVRNGADGRELGDSSWGGRTTSSIDGVRRSGASRLEEYLAASSAPTRTASPAADEETPWWAGERDEEEDEEEEEELPDDGSGRHDVLRVSLSAGSLWRSFWADAEVYAAQRDPAIVDSRTMFERRGYEGTNAELGFEAELYPGALGDQPFPWLGVLVSFRNSVGLSSSACRAANPTTCESLSIGTNQMDLQAGARGRYRFGERRGDPEIFAEVLYGYSTFTLDTNTLQLIDRNAIIPSMEYQYVSLGAGFRYGIVPDWLTVGLRFDYRAGIGVGTAAKNIWGLDTGPPGGFLVGLDLTHEASWIAPGIFASLRLEYFQMFTTFRGQVGCADPTSCAIDPLPWLDDGLWELWPADPANPDAVTGGIHDQVADHYVRFGFYLGYAFR